MGSGQSEQLPFFKDYYSQDEIRPGDSVAVLWAYQPRANDEFELERGEMIKVMGIWDDGWATGMKITQTADEWDYHRKLQRDSGMSNGSSRPVETEGEVKAFPVSLTTFYNLLVTKYTNLRHSLSASVCLSTGEKQSMEIPPRANLTDHLPAVLEPLNCLPTVPGPPPILMPAR